MYVLYISCTSSELVLGSATADINAADVVQLQIKEQLKLLLSARKVQLYVLTSPGLHIEGVLIGITFVWL